ncbi:MAG: hypothetical protein HY453_00095 [Parcubacteria group bacterium]|nr:hypothetical protein [Parcubacteria group bacterium]
MDHLQHILESVDLLAEKEKKTSEFISDLRKKVFTKEILAKLEDDDRDNIENMIVILERDSKKHIGNLKVILDAKGVGKKIENLTM